MKKRLIILFSFLLLLGVILGNLENIRAGYIYLFKISGSIKHYNSKGEYDGSVIEYVNGRISSEANYKNGLKERWTKQYYKNGALESEQFFKNDKLNGVEKGFYDNGNLNYISHWNNGIKVESGYHFSVNAKLQVYFLLDISSTEDKANFICYAEYNSFGKFRKLIGGVLGRDIYSKVNKDDDKIILTDHKRYLDIDDLYITVATPPGLIAQVEIDINKARYHNLDVKKNTLKISHAFNGGGEFKIVVIGKLINADKTIIDSDTLKTVIHVTPPSR